MASIILTERQLKLISENYLESKKSKIQLDESRNSGKSTSSLFSGKGVNISNKNGFSNIFSTIFGGSPRTL